MITNIETSRLIPHPKNPRGDLGDLTELAESIKSRGILQNLTVVPVDVDTYDKMVSSKRAYKGGYVVIIGHRRLAASKLAELAEVPCTIAKMDESEQISTMMIENLQRVDLTPYEQAQGFQMMLDLGENVEGIAQKTGFSKSTVYQRVKLLELDKDKFQAAAARGGTMQDYTALEKIKNVDLRNSVLDKIGTSNFKYELQAAVDKEKRQKKIAKVCELLDKFAKKKKSEKGLYIVKYISSPDDVKTPEDERNYFYTVSEYSVCLYADKPSQKQQFERVLTEEEKQRAERQSALKEASDRAYQLRRDFIADLTITKEHLPVVSEFVKDALKKGFKTATGSNTYHSWDGCYYGDKILDHTYEILTALGYEMSDEETALRDGTHELYVKDGENDAQE